MTENKKDYRNNSEYKVAVAELTAKGMSQLGIANTLGISQPTVSKIANQDDTKALIDRMQKKLIDSSLEQAVKNIKSVVDKYPTYEEEKDKGFTTLSLKYSAEIAKSVGILPAHAPSFHVQNIYNSATVTLSPLVQSMLNQFTRELVAPPPETIEVDWDE